MRKKKQPTVKALAKRVKVIESDMELKYNDFGWNNNSIISFDGTSPGVAVNTVIMVKGTGASGNRIGDEIRTTSLDIKFQLWITPTASVSIVSHYPLVRCVVFWDRQANGTLPVAFGNQTTQSVFDNSVITNNVLCPRNYNTIERFKILYDKNVTFHPYTVLQSTPLFFNNTHWHHIRLKLGRKVKYNAVNGGTYADVDTNSLYVLFATDADPGTPANLLGCSRVYYKDA